MGGPLKAVHPVSRWTADALLRPQILRKTQRVTSHVILYRVMRMRLKANARVESPSRLLEQLQRVHQQTVRTANGQVLHGLTEMTPTQKSLFTVLQLPIPTPAELSKPIL